MSKPSCSSCGSNSLDIHKGYYICNHCHSKFTTVKENNKREKRSLLSVRLKVFISFIILNILILNYYFFIYKQDIPEKVKVVKMNFWNNVYDWKYIEEIDDLHRTNYNTYLIISKNVVAELDATGNELWHKNIPSLVDYKTSKIIDVEDGYLISIIGYDYSNEQKTIKINKNREILFTLPYSFSSMVALGKEFVGVLQNKAIRVDKRGNVVWKKVLNAETYVKKAGRTRTSSGKSVRFKKTFFKVEFEQLLELKDGSLIALGESYNSNLESVKFSKDGKVIWKKSRKVHKIYAIRDAIATKDGGYIITIRNSLKFIKFNRDGILEFESIVDGYKSPWKELISELEDGYIITARVNEKFDHPKLVWNGLESKQRKSTSNILIVKMSIDGKIEWEKVYKHDNSLYVESMVKAFDGGILLSIRIRFQNWLVKMSDKGEIRTQFEDTNNLNDITKYKTLKKDKYLLEYVDDFYTHRGSRTEKIIPSKNKKYLYTLAGRSGLVIFDISDKKNILKIGTFRISRLPVWGGQYSVESTQYPYGGEGEYQFDSPVTLRISKDETRAYISDLNHGFYILDISNKTRPKHIGILPNCKIKYFVLSKEEDRIFSYNANKIISLDIRDTSFLKKEFKYYYYPNNHNAIEISKSGDLLYVIDKNLFKVFSVKDLSLVNSYKSLKKLRGVKLSSDEKLAYLLGDKDITILEIKDAYDYRVKNIIHTDTTFKINAFGIIDNDTIAYEADKGVNVVDISNLKNSSVVKTYTDESRTRVRTMSISENKDELYIGFDQSHIGIVNLKGKN
jgi:hypothetical protein